MLLLCPEGNFAYSFCFDLFRKRQFLFPGKDYLLFKGQSVQADHSVSQRKLFSFRQALYCSEPFVVRWASTLRYKKTRAQFKQRRAEKEPRPAPQRTASGSSGKGT